VTNLRRLAPTLVWWLLLVVLWALLVSSRSLAEMLAGIGFAGLAAGALEGVRREGRLRFRPRGAWAVLLFRLPLRVLVDTALVFRALGRLLRGRGLDERVRPVRFDAGASADARSAARRALAVWLVSAAPNTIAVDLDPDADVLLVHELEPRTTPPLGTELARREP
jgi:multisubunit Na+/H+ antiporter MnhE subunit